MMNDLVYNPNHRIAAMLRPQNYPVENQYLQRCGNELFCVGIATMQGFRDKMEDAHSAKLTVNEKHQNAGFFAVFDGHNGTKASHWCAENAHVAIMNLNELNEDSIRQAMVELDQKYFETTKDEANGTTAVFAIVRKTDQYPDKPFKVTVGNLGDSRCLVGHYSSSKFTCLTTDHKPCNSEEEARIKAAGGFVARGRVDACLGVARAVGDYSYKSNKNLPLTQQKIIPVPDVTETYLSSDDFLLICCDGIFESFSNENVMEYLHNHMKHNSDSAKVLSDLLFKVLSRGSRDNMTAMLIEFKNGVDYNLGDEFIAGKWYSCANNSYLVAYESNCKKYGKTLVEVQNMWKVRQMEEKRKKEEQKREEESRKKREEESQKSDISPSLDEELK